MNIYNKDIMDWDEFPTYDIIWCDPPWEQKMVNFFETMMVKKGQSKPNNTIEEIFYQLGKLAHKNKPLFIEYSLKGSDNVINIMKMNGHLFCGKIISIQENNNPYCILVFNTNDYLPNGSNQGFKIIEQTCKDFNFNVVFDPFAGIGKTAKAFLRNGKKYIGSEINTYRFNKLKEVVWHEQQ